MPSAKSKLTMEPLDLTIVPPRSPWQRLDGLALMPRTIDKMRARLVGGDIGRYQLRGLSTRLLEIIKIDEHRLQHIVAVAKSEDHVRRWLRINADVNSYRLANEVLEGMTLSHLGEAIVQRYPFAATLPPSTRVFDILDIDDGCTESF